ncbi:caspase family protein [Fulvivirgaceae bacterium BMA12]|uniref:Caspase family protein n=1 Tax=Agaribacillus aureus TaxID=3051825 RepID=A0ABT8LCJ9_9BACT|nr:caspase family protein [Fulvivirgaceae bacterium BMA12]
MKVTQFLSIIVLIFPILFGCTTKSLQQKVLEMAKNAKYDQNGLIKGNGKKYAILIGSSSFPGIKQLKGPSTEIKKISKLLADQCYSVISLVDEQATRSLVHQSIKQILKEMNPKDNNRLLFYFTGHGIKVDHELARLSKKVRQNLSGEYVLIPQQEDPQKPDITEVLSLEEIVGMMNSTRIYQKVIMIDACHGGHFASVDPLINPNIFTNFPLPDGLFILTSSKETVDDGQYGPLILEGLHGEADVNAQGNRDGFVSLWELTNYLHEKVNAKIKKNDDRVFASRYIFLGSGDVLLTKIKSQ